MRPLELRLSGFRSYRTERVISFRDMDIVAIIGDTGSGKSSILEAMTWALYGASTWSKRASSELLAHGARRMSVALEFEASGERWLVTRAYGSANTAVLECLSNTGFAKIDGARQVDPEIERLLGLPYDVFCSCVLLPQGKFERLLKATPGQKTDTLKSILRLETLGVMRERADELARKLADRERDVLEARGRFMPEPVATAERAAERIAALEPEQRRLSDLSAELVRLGESSRTHVEGARVSAAAAGQLAKRRGDHSAQLQLLAIHAGQLHADAEVARYALTAAEAERERAEADHLAAVEAGLDAPALTAAVGTVKAARATLRRIVELRARIAKDERTLTGVGSDLEAGRTALDSAERVVHAHDAARAQEQRAATAAAERARELADHAKRVRETADVCDGAGRALAAARTAGDASVTAHAAAQLALEQATAQRDLALATREAAQREHAVAHVAAGHHAGDPCPVCERTLPDGFEAPLVAGLDAADAAVAAATKVFSSAAEAERAAARTSERDADRAAVAEASLGDASRAAETALHAAEPVVSAARSASADISPAPVTVDDVTKAADAAADAARTVAARVEELDEARSGLEAARVAAQRRVSVVASEAKSLESGLVERGVDLDLAARELDDHLAALPAFCGVSEVSDAAFDGADAALAQRLEAARALDRRRAEVQKTAAKAADAVSAIALRQEREIVSPVAEHRTGLMALRGEVPEAELPEPLPGTGADVLAGFALALERAIDARVRALQAEADRHAAADVEARGAAARALEAAGFDGQGALDERLMIVRAETLAATREHGSASRQIEPAGLLDGLREGAGTMRLGFEALKDALADRAFVGFVVARRQRALLQHASRVLHEITGRYAFTDDFQILDNESGLPRSPDTLSGGETFIASLALALGLVEVADRSGGDLRALFLDEGFGTLDAAILDTALGALEDRARSGRLIGLISHVPTVAERVDTVLEVRADVGGSTVHVLGRDERDDRVLDAVAGAVGDLG